MPRFGSAARADVAAYLAETGESTLEFSLAGVATLEEHGAMEYTVVVNAPAAVSVIGSIIAATSRKRTVLRPASSVMGRS